MITASVSPGARREVCVRVGGELKDSHSLGLRREEKSSQAAKWEPEEWGGWACRRAWKPCEGERHARWRSTLLHWAGSKGQRRPAREEADEAPVGSSGSP